MSETILADYMKFVQCLLFQWAKSHIQMPYIPLYLSYFSQSRGLYHLLTWSSDVSHWRQCSHSHTHC